MTLFFRELFFFFKTVTVSQVILSLKTVKNKNIWQCDIMSTGFLISCVDGRRWKCCFLNEQVEGQAIAGRLSAEEGRPASGLGSAGRPPGPRPDTAPDGCVRRSKCLSVCASASPSVKWENSNAFLTGC